MIDFPRMIYHVVEDPYVVNGQKELDEHIKRGWSMTPETFSEVKAIRAKIAYHQAEADRLADKLIDLEDKATVKEMKNSETVEVVQAEKKKPGRPSGKAKAA